MKSKSSKTPTRFVVLFEGRSGSTFLVESLDSHSKIRAEKELLAMLKKRFKEGRAEAGEQLEWIENLYLTGNHDYEVVGFKTKFKDILDPEGLANLLKENEVRVILLQRRNRIKLLVSLLNAMRLNEATGDWNLYKESDRMMTLRVDVEEGQKWLEASEIQNRKLNDYARSLGLPFLELSYEDILVDQEKTFRQVCKFLGVAFEPLKGGTKKNTSDNLRDVLENFDELKDAFKGTRYEAMFDEILESQD
jgi:LPS sulfotransferase NodH